MTKLCVVWRTWTTTANFFSSTLCSIFSSRGTQLLCRDQQMSRNVQRTHHVAFAFTPFVPLQDAITITITLKNWIPDNNRHEQETFRSQVHTLDFDWTARHFCMNCTWFLTFLASRRTHHVAFAFNPFVPLQDAITITITLKNCYANQNSCTKVKLSPKMSKHVQSPRYRHVTCNLT